MPRIMWLCLIVTFLLVVADLGSAESNKVVKIYSSNIYFLNLMHLRMFAVPFCGIRFGLRALQRAPRVTHCEL